MIELDLWFVALVLLPISALSFIVGREWCIYHHRERGVEVGPPVIVPDHVPDWMTPLDREYRE